MKLALGCGHLDYRSKGYKNVDIRKLDHVDYVCDIGKKLPFEDSTIDEILAESVLEHIPMGRSVGIWEDPISHVNTILVLAEWRRVLKKGSKCIIKVPNLRALFLRYMEDMISPRDFWMYVYGGQNYPENTHVSGFFPETLIWAMKVAGFNDIVIRNAHNINETIDKDVAWEMAGIGVR